MLKAFWLGSTAKKGYPYNCIRYATEYITKTGNRVFKPTGSYTNMERTGSKIGMDRMNKAITKLEKDGYIRINEAWQKIA